MLAPAAGQAAPVETRRGRSGALISARRGAGDTGGEAADRGALVDVDRAVERRPRGVVDRVIARAEIEVAVDRARVGDGAVSRAGVRAGHRKRQRLAPRRGGGDDQRVGVEHQDVAVDRALGRVGQRGRRRVRDREGALLEALSVGHDVLDRVERRIGIAAGDCREIGTGVGAYRPVTVVDLVGRRPVQVAEAAGVGDRRVGTPVVGGCVAADGGDRAGVVDHEAVGVVVAVERRDDVERGTVVACGIRRRRTARQRRQQGRVEGREEVLRRRDHAGLRVHDREGVDLAVGDDGMHASGDLRRGDCDGARIVDLDVVDRRVFGVGIVCRDDAAVGKRRRRVGRDGEGRARVDGDEHGGRSLAVGRRSIGVRAVDRLELGRCVINRQRRGHHAVAGRVAAGGGDAGRVSGKRPAGEGGESKRRRARIE